MCARGRSLGDARLAPDGSTVAFVASSSAGAALVLVPSVGGPEIVVTSDPPVRPARGSGSGTFDWVPDGESLVYVGRDGRLWHQAASGGAPRAVVEVTGVGAPAVSPDGTRVAFVVDDRHVAVARLDDPGPWPVRVSGRADFCADPVWSPDGQLVAWHEWSVPAMAWDDSRIVIAPAPPARPGGPGSASADRPWPVQVAGPVAVGQPRFTPDGTRIGFLCDAAGWLNLWSARADGTGAAPLVEEPYEHGGPTWGSGQRSWTWSPDGSQAAFARNECGFGRLCVAASDGAGPALELDTGVFAGLSWRSDRLAALRSGARTPDQIVVYPTARHPTALGAQPAAKPGSAPPPERDRTVLPGPRTVLARGPLAGFESAGLVEPEVVSWTAEDRPSVGSVVHGRLSRASRPNPLTPAGDTPPLIVWVHGGPTGQSEVTFNARASFFVARGWNVLQADPRGSTGWGREYTQALRGEWGRLDVEDLAAGIRAAVAEGWGHPGRVAIMGASSGGLAVLEVLARYPELCAAGVDLYGVTDLFDLDETTHRFEAHYNWSLVGPLPAAAAAYRDRSPIRHTADIRAPLLVLHGSEDRTVPAAQSEALVAALAARGATVDYHCYPGEGHGWSSPETIIDELERIDAFLTRHVLRGQR
jgi:dipeptidyl aminopeptidase/acylaminoacyl peptidase